jgi:iron complex transport system permease protein
VTLSTFCAAAAVLVQSTSDFVEVNRMLRWMLGGLESMRMLSVQYAAVPIATGLVVLLAYARELDALAAGAEAAASVGVSVGRTQVVVFGVTSLLVGAAIALAGPIGFVGLIVPHALRALIGSAHRALIPASVFAGGALLVACDTLARCAFAADQLPTGAVTAVLGVPFFIAILVRHKRHAMMWA